MPTFTTKPQEDESFEKSISRIYVMNEMNLNLMS